MSSASALRTQLSGIEPAKPPYHNFCGPGEDYIVVFRHYRFYKQLSVEIYIAGKTKTGKLKNPLRLINPLDLALQRNEPNEIRFFTAISRFQNDPTSVKSDSHIQALKIILGNPMNLRLFFHDHSVSGNVLAASLREVYSGGSIQELAIHIFENTDCYLAVPEISISGSSKGISGYSQQYDYFVQSDSQIFLLTKIFLIQLYRFFSQFPDGHRIEKKDMDGYRDIFSRADSGINVIYHENALPVETAKPDEKISEPECVIYLSDLDSYVIINPVMKYHHAEVPVLSKKNYYSKSVDGRLHLIQRDDKAEIHFTALLLRQHPDFTEQLENDLTHFYLHKQRFLDENWFLQTFEDWRAAGITVLGFNQLKGNRLNSNKANISIKVLSGMNWFNTVVDVRFGKTKATLKQIHQSVKNKTKFIQLDDGTNGILPEEWLHKFDSYFKNWEIDIDSLRIPKSAFNILRATYDEENLPEDIRQEINTYEKKLLNFEGLTDVQTPPALKTTLRDYQKHGLNWLNMMDDLNFGCCLADDMGLGKTIQIIAFILTQRYKVQQNSNLVVVPTSLLFNWQTEIQKFAPDLPVFIHHGSNRIKSTDGFTAYEVILTTYGTVITDASFLRGFQFNYIFLDESQMIKNVESQRYYSVRQLQSRNKIVITGTPVENNTLDLYAQMSFACPGLLGNKQSFRDLFSIPIDRFQSSRNATALREKVSPFILRRTKQEVAKELPHKTEITLYCPMEEPQRKVYEAYEKEFRDFVSGITEDELHRNSAHVLKGLTRLRQICDSPLLLPDERLYSDRSSKIDILIDQILNKSSDHKILVFSQFVSMLKLIRTELDKTGISYEYLTGDTRNRKTVVDNFQQKHSARVFLISLKAGGTGLNLTAADYVYLVDPWWNPAVENQAIDRIYRIGQQKNVMAVRLICPGTLEEKISQLQMTKKLLSDNLLYSEADTIKIMNREVLLSLVQP